MRVRAFLGCVLMALALPSFEASPTPSTPVLEYDTPAGFSRGKGDPHTWIATGLDALIQVYPFRSFHGNFEDEFQRTLFRDWIAALYREDRRLDRPAFHPLQVDGATAAMTVAFRNFNGGAPRQHLRAAVLARDRVAVVDMSTNSTETFERNRLNFTRLLNSLRVVFRDSSQRGGSSRRRAAATIGAGG